MFKINEIEGLTLPMPDDPRWTRFIEDECNGFRLGPVVLAKNNKSGEFSLVVNGLGLVSEDTDLYCRVVFKTKFWAHEVQAKKLYQERLITAQKSLEKFNKESNV